MKPTLIVPSAARAGTVAPSAMAPAAAAVDAMKVRRLSSFRF